jgi:hypothetical protein
MVMVCVKMECVLANKAGLRLRHFATLTLAPIIAGLFFGHPVLQVALKIFNSPNLMCPRAVAKAGVWVGYARASRDKRGQIAQSPRVKVFAMNHMVVARQALVFASNPGLVNVRLCF